MKKFIAATIMILALFVAGCGEIKLFTGASDPLKQYVLSGKGTDKVLVISVKGFISDEPKSDFLTTKPSLVQDVVSQLELAQKDKNIKAIVLKINSPGGTTTASDILYHEINEFKKRTNKKIVAVFMDVAASGGYYIALPADYIVAHPTTVTGSVGVVFIQPALISAMDKIGVGVRVVKSGENKDMGSPFRKPTQEEKEITQKIIANLGDKFAALVAKHRNLDDEAMKNVKTARIYVADKALELGLVDEVGYLVNALNKAKSMANAAEDSKVVVYRRTKYHNDNVYNMSMNSQSRNLSMINLNLPPMLNLSPGFYYLWTQPGW